MRGKALGVFAILLLIAFLIALTAIATLPLESGDAYPAYSSFRADPLGTKALFESLSALEDLRVKRNFEPLPKLKSIDGTVLLLGERLGAVGTWSEPELKFYESLVNSGGRLVFAFLPVPPRSADAPRLRPKEDYRPAIVKRWKLDIDWPTGTDEEIEQAGALPRQTAAYFKPEDQSGWRIVERNKKNEATLVEHDFGKGRILMLTESYPLSNEGLRATRPVPLIEELTGASSTKIVFDESHLGVANTGSVGTLIRQYRLTGAFAVLLLLAGLFLWKNSTSLLPQAPETQPFEAATGADSQSGLVNLLKRSVPPPQLTRACWERWKETRALGRPVSDQRVARAEAILPSSSSMAPPAKQRGGQAELYRKIQAIFSEKL